MAVLQPPHNYGPRAARLIQFAAIAAYLAYTLGVQGMQAGSRAIEVHHLASVATVLAVRFQLVALVATLGGLIRVARTGSWGVFHPGDGKLKTRAKQGALQAAQTIFIVLAAAELAGKFQAAVSLSLVGLWANGMAAYWSWRGEHAPVRLAAWAYPAIYAAVALLVGTTTGAAQGSLWLGLGFMTASGYCTARLHVLYEDSARESKITSTIWQNGPAAVVSILLWFLPAPFVGQAVLPSDHKILTVVLLIAVAACSLGQQVAQQTAAWLGKKVGMGTTRLVPLRGAQVYFGAGLDSLFFANPPHGTTQWAAMVMVAAAMGIGWVATRPKPHQS